MKELVHRSQELQEQILRNKALLQALTETTAEVLKGRVEIPDDQVYVFIPRVYRRPLFVPEIFMSAASDLAYRYPRPEPGPLDPWLVKVLDAHRFDIAAQAPSREGVNVDLREQITRDAELLATLSDSIAGILDEHGISLQADETYGFEAVTLRRPIFKVQASALPRSLMHRHAAHAQQWEAHLPRWYQGIPAPEMLVAMEQMRLT
jgi:hypothetical protein